MARFRKNPDAPRQRVNLTLDPVIYEGAQELAYAEGVSVSEMVNQLLSASLDANAQARVAAARSAREAKERNAKEVAETVRKTIRRKS